MDTEDQIAKGRAPNVLLPSGVKPSTRKPGQTAAHAVIFTPELLCNIIASLPLEDIVASTGVCHFWRNAAAADPAVQKALFLDPEQVSRTLLLETELDRAFEHWSLEHKPGAAIPQEWCYTIGKLHPFLHRICGVANTREFIDPQREMVNKEFTPDFDHREGTWQHMFVSQPPCRHIDIQIEQRWGMGEVNFYGIHNRDGVSLGYLYNAILYCLE